MRRLQFRLGTLALLIVIIALATALVAQRRRETALQARMEAVQEESEAVRRISHRLSAYIQSQKNEQWAKETNRPADKKSD
jgi:hypothetical protein